MMGIVIDREKRIMLLRWLKQGVIDSRELDRIRALEIFSEEEIEKKVDAMYRIDRDEICERIKQLGYCKVEQGDK